MKTSSSIRVYFILICVAGITAFSCNQSGKKENPAQHVTLKNLDKDTLLNIVAVLAKTLQSKDHATAAGKKFLKLYSSIYKINIGGAPNHAVDSVEYLNVFVYDDKEAQSEMVVFRLYPPESLRRQITFADLEKNYGKWIQLPPREEAFTTTCMFTLKNAPDVSVSVDSKDMPGKANNSIELISVMR